MFKDIPGNYIATYCSNSLQGVTSGYMVINISYYLLPVTTGIGVIDALISIALMWSASGNFGPRACNPFWPFSILLLRLTKSGTNLPLFDLQWYESMYVVKIHHIAGIVSSDKIPSAGSHVSSSRSTFLALNGAAVVIPSPGLSPSSLC
jgi:hypothetical protein